MARAYSPMKTYRLQFHDGDRGAERAIEFEASSTEAALLVAQRHCVDRPAQLFERDRCLGSISLSSCGGFWKLSGRAAVNPAAVTAGAPDMKDRIPPS